MKMIPGLKLNRLLLATATAMFSMNALADVANGNFDDYDVPVEGTILQYDFNEGPPGWFLTAADDGGSVSYIEADVSDRGGYFRFNALADGFGSSKLEQCVPIDDNQNMSIAYKVYAETPTVDADGLSIRINPNFYATIEDCLFAQFDDSGGDRLDGPGTRPNDDMDFGLGEEDGQHWIERSPAQQPPLTYLAAEIPEGASYMNISVRARNRGPEGFALRFDDIRVTQGASSTNLVVNGLFEHAELFDGDFLAGTDGWFVNRGGDPDARAAIGPVAFALSGDNVFHFEDLTGNFGVNRLDQCFLLDGASVRPSVYAYTLRPDPDLAVRLDIGFYTDAECNDSAPGELGIQQDFPLDVDPASWVPLVASEMRTAGEYADAESAMMSIRVRDRSGDGNVPGDYARIVFFDDASTIATVATPVFSPAPGEYVDSVSVTMSSATDNAVIYYTLDGSEPDFESANVPGGDAVEITESATLTARAFLDGAFSASRSGEFVIVAAGDVAEPPVSGPLNRSTGCSVSGEPSVMDPVLWLLLVAAIGGLAWRRRQDMSRSNV